MATHRTTGIQMEAALMRIIIIIISARMYDRNLLWNCKENQSLRMLLDWIPAFPMKIQHKWKPYSLKSWLWLAAVACVVRWSVSNALLNDIWLTRFTRMCGQRHVNRSPIDHPYKCHENTNHSRVPQLSKAPIPTSKWKYVHNLLQT